jgi:hypothetical protein
MESTLMTANELANFLREKVPTFEEVVVVGQGTGYHYTPYVADIEVAGKLIGAPINGELDRTQVDELPSRATNDPGVIFAYPEFDAARDEAHGGTYAAQFVVLELNYREAVAAYHAQERALDPELPPTLLILTTDIVGFKRHPAYVPATGP